MATDIIARGIAAGVVSQVSADKQAVSEDRDAVEAAKTEILNVAESIPEDYSTLSADVSELKEDINELEPEIYAELPVSMNLTLGKFWDISGETAELKDISQWYASAIIPVTEGEVYTVYADQGPSHKTRVWTLCDDELNILARAEDIYDDVMSLDTFTVVSGATKLVISHKSHVPDVPYLTKKVSRINELNSEFIDD